MEIFERVGVFFLILGLGILFIFWITVEDGAPLLNYFCWGIMGLMLGGLLISRHRQPAEKPERFKWLNKFLSRKDK